MKSRIIIWGVFYACTLVAAGGAIWIAFTAYCRMFNAVYPSESGS